ncbi:GGDEF domain-containing protein [Pontibacillus litoralis]|nr:GGDEF domain-containing protein [Pontibacillus litoralis]
MMLTFIGEIAEAIPMVSKSTLGLNVNQLFEQHPDLEGAVVGHQGIIDGLLMKNKFYQKIAVKYGYDLFMGRPIELIMDTSPLVVDYYDSIIHVSTKAMHRTQSQLYDYVIVTNNGSFYGIVSIKDLLQTFAEVQTYLARFSNPLTGLPGNIMIEEQLERALCQPEYSIFYFDLNQFKAYNDLYGFKQGDLVIRETAAMIQDGFYGYDSNKKFVGHIGGDDFIGIIHHYNYRAICEHILRQFDQSVRHFYSLEDLDRGFVIAYDRDKKLKETPLLSLAIAVITNQHTTFHSTNELSAYASQLKSFCKLTSGSRYVVDVDYPSKV